MAIDFPNSPTVGQSFSSGALAWVWDGTKWTAATAASAPYIVGCFVPGVMTATQSLLLHTYPRAVTIPANFASYSGHASEGRGTVNATASTAIAVQKATAGSPGSFTGVGTITIAAGAQVATFASTGGTTIPFAQGDTLALVGPTTPDTTFANFAATLVGYES